MKKSIFVALASVFLLGGCTALPGAAGSDLAGISYETGPCFGACPDYRLSVRADGQGTFEGRRDTAVTGTRSFTVTTAQFQALAAHLAPLRPASGSVRYSGEACAMMATDLPSAEVVWEPRSGPAQSLYFYYGCDMEKNEAIAERMRRVPDLLPVGAFIGPR